MSRTGPEVASICGRGLAKGKRGVTDDEFKDVCASGLRQVEQAATFTEIKRYGEALKKRMGRGSITPRDAITALVAFTKPRHVKPDTPAP